MSHRVVIIQSNYIPWRGYFDLLARADTVVLFDAVQSTKNDWRNRNQIKTASGKQWLSIPVRHSTSTRIRDVAIANPGWHRKHLRTIANAYARAPFFDALMPVIEGWYQRAGEERLLSAVNRTFMHEIGGMLEVGGRFIEVESILDDATHDALAPTDRLVRICRELGASSYLSGPAARAYLDVDAFRAASIEVEWFDYDGYLPYPQLHGAFDPAVSILDLLLMTGPDARRYALRDPVRDHRTLELPT